LILGRGDRPIGCRTLALKVPFPLNPCGHRHPCDTIVAIDTLVTPL
jgi:hypothetical protein